MFVCFFVFSPLPILNSVTYPEVRGVILASAFLGKPNIPLAVGVNQYMEDTKAMQNSVVNISIRSEGHNFYSETSS